MLSLHLVNVIPCYWRDNTQITLLSISAVKCNKEIGVIVKHLRTFRATPFPREIQERFEFVQVMLNQLDNWDEKYGQHE